MIGRNESKIGSTANSNVTIEVHSRYTYLPTGELSVLTFALGNDDVSVALNAPDVVKSDTDALMSWALMPLEDETV